MLWVDLGELLILIINWLTKSSHQYDFKRRIESEDIDIFDGMRSTVNLISLSLLTFCFIVLSGCSQESFDSINASGIGYDNVNGDQFNEYEENQFIEVSTQPISTFSVDADGGSYAYARRQLEASQLPPVASIRTEEFINYFNLDYPDDNLNNSVSLNGEISGCPWNRQHKLIRIGIKGKDLPVGNVPASNFVFLIDVSGSMGSSDKLALLQQGFKLLVDELTADDRIALVTYAGSSSVVLQSTPGNEKDKIKKAIDNLSSGGGTAGAEGINTAYEIAEANFITGGNNRVIIGTDGDFNIGISSQEELINLIEEKRKSNIYLSVLGVGSGNLNEGTMEQIANKGNGNYEYLDKVEQLKKVFVYEKSKFFTAAKDVKVQVVFNPSIVHSYRLIGYENRVLDNSEFENDSADAGEIGCGQSITALYEIIPTVSPLNKKDPTFTIDFRYKEPDSEVSSELSLDILDAGNSFESSSDHMKFACGVASFGMLLGKSEFKGTSNYDSTIIWLNRSNLSDNYGFKSELIDLVKTAKKL